MSRSAPGRVWHPCRASQGSNFLAPWLFVCGCLARILAVIDESGRSEDGSSPHASTGTRLPCITMHTAVKMPSQRRARMQEDTDVGIALTHANSNQMGSHITSDCCVQRPCNAKLYALRTGRHGGQREQRLSRPSRNLSGKTEMQVAP